MNETAFQNECASNAVLVSMVLALIQANPSAGAAGLANAARLRELAVNLKQPDAFLAGLDVALAFWRKQLGADAG
jgi:hypothetical protein